ncbi:hypothetical protein DPMN_074410 [Dreissena polymorpha]|uniref:Uncharacterized protein n=1 Tax=Dreissena polymorpha TaxID=45954 RepID=A0A9D4BKM3_DREPO|nr:hypothetical protein DPMN_074410 [Dreissena polymorpha]
MYYYSMFDELQLALCTHPKWKLSPLITRPVEVRAAIGKTESLKRAIRRKKRGVVPVEPAGSDNALAEAEVYRYEHGEPLAKRVRKGTLHHQKKMQRLCEEVASGNKTAQDFLAAVGHCIRIHV